MKEKLICVQCGKQDFNVCVMDEEKTFCCAVCRDTYKKSHEKDMKEKDEKMVCTFC